MSEAARIQLGVPPSNRLFGSNRYQTAIAIAGKARSASWLTGSPTIFGIATSLPDALAAGPMLGAKGGPLLLSAPGGATIRAETSGYLTNPASVPSLGYGFVCGGTDKVPEAARLGLMGTLNP